MIFLTVGAQMPFDRLVKAVDDWAASHGENEIYAQIGPSTYRPRHIQWTQFVEPAPLRRKMEQSLAIIAHAGMGTILTALELGKPILVMPRRGCLYETRNDHQVATARQFAAQGRIAVAYDEIELAQKLDDLRHLHAAQVISSSASPALLSAVGAFIQQTAATRAFASPL